MELDTALRTMKTERRDFPEWHRGRSPFVFWAVDLDLPEPRAELARAAAYLGDLLLDDYRRQAHVTLDLCGFPNQHPTRDDEFNAGFLHGQIARLREGGLRAFELEIGGLSSFRSAPYLAVNDPSASLAVIRSCLAESGCNRLFGDYVPHCTVGLYGGDWPALPVAERLRAFPGAHVLRVRIERISLMSYQPCEIAGSLQILGDYWLCEQRMVWRPDAENLYPENI